MWLMKHKSLSRAAAYDAARREFYQHRHLEDIRRRIAKEEALHVGAYFGMGPLEIGMELEDQSWEGWKQWAAKQIEDEQQMRAQMFSGPQTSEASKLDIFKDEANLQEAQEAQEAEKAKAPESAVSGLA